MKSKAITFILFFSHIVLNASPVVLQDSLYEEDPYFILMGEADNAIKREDWHEAIARLNDAISVKPTEPSNSLLYSNLGALYSSVGEDSLAIDSYDRALDIAPNLITPLLGRGRLYLSLGKEKEAYADFTRVIQIDSINTDARYYRGMMALYGGVRPMAEEDFTVLESVTPRSMNTAIAMSTLYAMTGRDSQAIPYLKNLIKNAPSPEFYATLSGCYLTLDRLNEASETISDGLKLYPNDAELYYYRAWLNKERYRHEDAQEDAEKAIKLGANPLKIKQLLAK